MSNNDLVLVKQLIEQRQKEVAPDIPASEYFQLFVSEQALKDWSGPIVKTNFRYF